MCGGTDCSYSYGPYFGDARQYQSDGTCDDGGPGAADAVRQFLFQMIDPDARPDVAKLVRLSSQP